MAGSTRSANAPFDGAGLAGLVGAGRSADSDGSISEHTELSETRNGGTGPEKGQNSGSIWFHDVQLDLASATGAAAKRRE